jgi:hypothetical protein
VTAYNHVNADAITSDPLSIPMADTRSKVRRSLHELLLGRRLSRSDWYGAGSDDDTHRDDQHAVVNDRDQGGAERGSDGLWAMAHP